MDAFTDPDYFLEPVSSGTWVSTDSLWFDVSASLSGELWAGPLTSAAGVLTGAAEFKQQPGHGPTAHRAVLTTGGVCVHLSSGGVCVHLSSGVSTCPLVLQQN